MVSLLYETSVLTPHDSLSTLSSYRKNVVNTSAISRSALYDIVFENSHVVQPESRQKLEEELDKLCYLEKNASALKIRAAYELGVRSILSHECRLEFSSPSAVEYHFAQKMSGFDQEHFVMLCLNAKNILIEESELSVGTLDKTIVGVRDVVKRALMASARSIILVHNHPSGDPHPSHADVELTKRIEKGCDLFEICVLDHVIIGKEGRSYSLRSCGDMS